MRNAAGVSIGIPRHEQSASFDLPRSQLDRTRSGGETSPLAELTPRELDVLRLMAQGRTNRGIAEALYLSESAVEKHVRAIGKLRLVPEPGVDRRVTAVLTFLRRAPERPDTDAGRE